MTHQPIICTECGQPIHVRDGVAYAVDGEARHYCATHTVPAWVRESVEYQALEVEMGRLLREAKR